jgi:hypothetical protein
MKPSKPYEALHALIGERVPMHIWRACGIGESQIVAQVSNGLDYDFLDVYAVRLDPVDLRGLPRIAADQTEWVPSSPCPRCWPSSYVYRSAARLVALNTRARAVGRRTRATSSWRYNNNLAGTNYRADHTGPGNLVLNANKQEGIVRCICRKACPILAVGVIDGIEQLSAVDQPTVPSPSRPSRARRRIRTRRLGAITST